MVKPRFSAYHQTLLSCVSDILRAGTKERLVLSRRNFLGMSAFAVAGLAQVKNLSATLLSPTPGLSPQASSPDPTLVEHARTLLRQAPFIETHNDLPSMLLEVKSDLAKYDLSKIQP